eukprot:TRINITY_DN53247_c0_g2_i1.p1 TRINITY_DN53247_c0_g2~~TRINITY_DN53247_c0_g2_i1.p1  ORF type:complete len:431 (-),score=48.22 TRINITY_DN53247_c0_g2_i1:186-1478(-)
MAYNRSSSQLQPLGSGYSNVSTPLGGFSGTGGHFSPTQTSAASPPAALSPGGTPATATLNSMGIPSTPNKTRSKLSELNAKICDMDVELVNQNRTRQSKQVAIENVQADMQAYTKGQKRLQSALTEMEDRIQRLENALCSERGAREVVSKNLQLVLEERVTKLVTLLEQEEDRHNNDLEVMKARIRQLEDRNKLLEMQLCEQDKQFVFVRDTQIPKMGTHINTLLRVTEQEKIKGGGGGGGGGGDGGGVPKKFQTQLLNLQNDLTAERVARERDNDHHRKTIATRFGELQTQLTLERREREQVQERVIEPVWAELKKFHEEVDREKREREESVSTQSQGVLDKLNIVKTGLEKATISIDEQQNKRLRQLDDRLWKLSYELEAEVSARKEGWEEISGTLAGERKQREETEEEVFDVIEKLSNKLRDGMELE